VRHDRAGHADDPEEVRIEDGLRLFDRALLRSGRSDAEACIVHEHIDPAGAPHHLLDRGIDGSSAGHVEGQALERALARGTCPPAGTEDSVASLGEPLRRGLADAG
jgi:hypothetical protein